MPGRKLDIWHRKDGAVQMASKRNLLGKVWGLEGQAGKRRADAYLNHYRNLLPPKDIPLTHLNLSSSIDYIELVEILKQHGNFHNQSGQSPPLSDMLGTVRAQPRRWLPKPDSDEAIIASIRAALELWLFTSPPLDDLALSLGQANKRYVSMKISAQAASVINNRRLSPDFSAKSLTRKGGFYFVYTPNLVEHLTFASKNHIRFFQHACILREYQVKEPERSLYPDGLLEETHRTVGLLYPYGDSGSSRRIHRIGKREHVDIEAHIDRQMDQDKQFHLSSYPFYAERLLKIQDRYDQVKPSTLKQWWYDRRRREEWGALMIASVAFILTVIYGTISAITGIMQVYASFRYR